MRGMSIKNVPKFQKIGFNDLIVCVGKVEMHKYMQYEAGADPGFDQGGDPRS